MNYIDRMDEVKGIDLLCVPGRLSVDRIRNSPETVFKHKGIDGALYAVTLLFKAFVTEIALGHGDRLNVALLADGKINKRQQPRTLYRQWRQHKGKAFLAAYPTPLL